MEKCPKLKYMILIQITSQTKKGIVLNWIYISRSRFQFFFCSHKKKPPSHTAIFSIFIILISLN